MSQSIFKTKSGENYLFPFILITTLFFLWGFAHSLLDILNKHFQDALDLSKAQSGLVQASAYGAYFIMAIPAGFIAKRFGYKNGVLLGLLLFAIGCFWFVPAVGINQFWAFLLGLLVIFSGLTFLETVANPYTTILGDPKFAASRINLAQTFNALGWILGPLLGSLFIFKNNSSDTPLVSFAKTLKIIFTGIADNTSQVVMDAGKAENNSALIIPYVGLGVVVVLVILMFFFAKLPDANLDSETNLQELNTINAGNLTLTHKPLLQQKHFVMAVVAQFFYVAAQTGIGSFFVNYTVETKSLGIGEMQAGILLGLGGMGLFATGRFLGSALMRYLKPELLLGTFALINTILMMVTTTRHDNLGIIALIFSYLFMSIMFPSIFALGIRGLGEQTKTASSIMVMTIVGGAVCPALMGVIGEKNMNIGFIVPMLCFAYIAIFGFIQLKKQIKVH